MRTGLRFPPGAPLQQPPVCAYMHAVARTQTVHTLHTRACKAHSTHVPYTHGHTAHTLHAHARTDTQDARVRACTHAHGHTGRTGTRVHTGLFSGRVWSSLQAASVAGQVGVSLLEEEVTRASKTLDRGTARRGGEGWPPFLREDTGWRKLVAHRTFWYVETGWAHFGGGP